MKNAAVYVALAVLVVACTSTEEATTTSVGDSSTPNQAVPSADSSTPADSSPSPSGSTGEQLPIIPLIAASQDPAGMGEPIDLKADERLSGDVYLVGPDGDLASGCVGGLRDRYTGESKDQQTTGDGEDERCLQVDLSLNPLGQVSRLVRGFG